LKSIPSEHKTVLINFLTKLNRAVEHWQACCEIPVAKS